VPPHKTAYAVDAVSPVPPSSTENGEASIKLETIHHKKNIFCFILILLILFIIIKIK
jgi:hypothetical protein